MKQLIKTTTGIGATEIVLVLVAIVKNKYLALTIGVDGLGIFGLVQSFFNIFIIFAGYWLATGVTKYTSEFYKKNDILENRKIFSFSISITLLISLFLCIIFLSMPIKYSLFIVLITHLHPYIIFNKNFRNNCLRNPCSATNLSTTSYPTSKL